MILIVKALVINKFEYLTPLEYNYQGALSF